MKAMILAAGLGTRLKELTKDRPKALVEVNGVAMLELVARRLIAAGVSELVINLHYKGELIKDYVRARNDFGIRVHYSQEPQILGTGGGIKKAQQYLDGNAPFFVHNCDVFSDCNLPLLLQQHLEAKADASLLTLSGSESSYLLVDPKKRLCGWEVKGEIKECLADRSLVQRQVFSGIQVLSSSIFNIMAKQGTEFSIVETYLLAAKAGLNVRTELLEHGYWIDVGTPSKLDELRAKLARG